MSGNLIQTPTKFDSAVAHPDSSGRLHVRMATDQDREVIYRIRHDVYAAELGQHPANQTGRLTDSLDAYNTYIVISEGSDILGFVSITPPAGKKFSIDKYVKREQLPFPFDDKLYEVRLLTVPQMHRQTLLALALMYASFRWVEARGGTRIIAIGRREIRSMHLRVGLKPVGIDVQAGAVTYGVLQATMNDVHEALPGIGSMLERIEADMSWDIGVPFNTPAPCYHGGQFFTAVGEEFDSLERLDQVISADVLDAWFPPAPEVVAALERHLPRLLQTSPPTGCEGLIRAIARARGVQPECILPGGGSSDLIYLALRHWLKAESRVLILDPTYGEYIHLLEQVIRCRVDRLVLSRAADYRLDVQELQAKLKNAFDLVVLVNPNSPTGQHVARVDLERVVSGVAPSTQVWLDETYIDYAGPEQSLERFASMTENVVVCKSMSKTFALSGARVAYLCASPQRLESLRSISPPWAVSLPAQVAAVRALEAPGYYAQRYEETHKLRDELMAGLRELGWDVVPSVTNFLLCHLPERGPDASTVIARSRARGLFLRETSSMSAHLGPRTIRVAVKDNETNFRMLTILQAVCREP